MFNNWILSGILLEKQTSKWENLNELFYYENRDNKENKIDYYIRCENIEKDIEILCENLKIPKFSIKPEKKRPHRKFVNKKLSDYYTEESVSYIEKNFSFSINIGKYKFEKDQVYVQS